MRLQLRRLKLRPSVPWFVAATLLLSPGASHAVNIHRTVVSKSQPLYPELARRMHVGGVVRLHIVIQPNGTVSQTDVESGHPLLAAAAQDAVRRWRYNPCDETSENTVEISFDFNEH